MYLIRWSLAACNTGCSMPSERLIRRGRCVSPPFGNNLPILWRLFVAGILRKHLRGCSGSLSGIRPSLSAQASSRSPVHTHTPVLHLGLAKALLALHAVSLALIAVSKDAGLFFAVSILATLDIGCGLVVQSLSLELYVHRSEEVSEAGQLLGTNISKLSQPKLCL